MGVTKERLRELAARDSLSCYLPYVAWEEGMYVLADASLGFMWEINPLLFAGEDAKRILGGLLGDRVLPPGTSVKFHVFASELIPRFSLRKGRRRTESAGRSPPRESGFTPGICERESGFPQGISGSLYR